MNCYYCKQEVNYLFNGSPVFKGNYGEIICLCPSCFRSVEQKLVSVIYSHRPPVNLYVDVPYVEVSEYTYYGLSSSQTEPPEDWQETLPMFDEERPYLWTVLEKRYSDGRSHREEPTYVGDYNKYQKEGKENGSE